MNYATIKIHVLSFDLFSSASGSQIRPRYLSVLAGSDLSTGFECFEWSDLDLNKVCLLCANVFWLPCCPCII